MIEVGDWWEPAMFLLLRGPHRELRRMRRYILGAEDFWTAMMLGEDKPPPSPDLRHGVCLFGIIPEEAKAATLSFYERVESVN